MRERRAHHASATQDSNRTGQPLPAALLTPLEPLFGHDIARVRIHADDAANERAASLHARAYTLGQEIFFARDALRPDQPEGRALLLHELMHTVQQRAGNTCDGEFFNSAAVEGDANRATGDLLSGHPPSLTSTPLGIALGDEDDSSWWRPFALAGGAFGSHVAGGAVPGGFIANAAQDAMVAQNASRSDQFAYGMGTTAASVFNLIVGGAEIFGGGGEAVVASPTVVGSLPGLAVAAEGVNEVTAGVEGLGAGIMMMMGGRGNRGGRGRSNEEEGNSDRAEGRQRERERDQQREADRARGEVDRQGGPKTVQNVHPSPESALGGRPVRFVQEVEMDNPGMVAQGYTKVRYYVTVEDGVQSTLAYNPRSGSYVPFHASSQAN